MVVGITYVKLLQFLSGEDFTQLSGDNANVMTLYFID